MLIHLFLFIAAVFLEPNQDVVVVYTALDRGFSEPILQAFEKESGIKVLAVYDTEAAKSVGLANRIRAEKNRPRCDVYWNNEILNTLRLKKEGLLQPCQPAEAKNYPDPYRDPEGYWYGFAARARVLLVNTSLVKSGEEPKSILDLTDPKWKGKVGIAKPLFGTTATHIVGLFAQLGEDRAKQFLSDLKSNDVKIMSGNKGCAEAVSAGIIAMGLTDTDDALIELENNKPVKIVYLDSESNQLGTLFIPNTLAKVKGGPNPQGAKKLINYLLSLEVEKKLSEGPSAQIPLHKDFQGTLRTRTPQQIQSMKVDWAKTVENYSPATKYIEDQFLK